MDARLVSCTFACVSVVCFFLEKSGNHFFLNQAIIFFLRA